MHCEQLNQFIVDKLDDMKAVDITVLDVRGKNSITDFMILCTGNSKRHVSAIANHVAKEAVAAKIKLLGSEGIRDGEWVVIDLGDAIVHVMQDEQRQLYQLEKLWN